MKPKTITAVMFGNSIDVIGWRDTSEEYRATIMQILNWLGALNAK